MVIQEVKIKFKADISNEVVFKEFRNFTDKYLLRREGFVNRFYFKNSENIWILYIFYNTKEEALKSISDYQKWEGSHDILMSLDKEGLIFHHYDMEDPLLN